MPLVFVTVIAHTLPSIDTQITYYMSPLLYTSIWRVAFNLANTLITIIEQLVYVIANLIGLEQ